MSSKEVPQGLKNIINQVKETPEYQRKILAKQVDNLSSQILKKYSTSNHGSRYVDPVFRKVGEDMVALKIGENVVQNNGGSMDEVVFEIAVNPSHSYADGEFRRMFKISTFGVFNKKSEEATISELTEYIEVLNYFDKEANSDRRSKRSKVN